MLLPIYEQSYTVPPSDCGYDGRLSVADALSLFQDISSVHASLLKGGVYDLAKKDLFWLTVKTKAHFECRPRLGDTVTLATWPENLTGVRCLRDYTITKGDDILISGKTEWAIINLQTGKLHKAEEVYPPELQAPDKVILPEPFVRFEREAPEEILGTYTVRSTDIDLGGHMNNIAYLRAFMGLLPVDKQKSMPCRDLEIHFRAQCFEGDTLTFRQKQEGGALWVHALLPDGKTAVQIMLR